jgi:hypothetical protein
MKTKPTTRPLVKKPYWVTCKGVPVGLENSSWAVFFYFGLMAREGEIMQITKEQRRIEETFNALRAH